MILLKFSKFDCYFSMIIAGHEAIAKQRTTSNLKLSSTEPVENSYTRFRMTDFALHIALELATDIKFCPPDHNSNVPEPP